MRENGRLEAGDVVLLPVTNVEVLVDYVNNSGAYVIPTARIEHQVRAFNTKTGEDEVSSFTSQAQGFYITSCVPLATLVRQIANYTSRTDRSRVTMGTREGALKAAATRRLAKQAAAAADPNRPDLDQAEVPEPEPARKPKAPKAPKAPKPEPAPVPLVDLEPPMSDEEHAQIMTAAKGDDEPELEPAAAQSAPVPASLLMSEDESGNQASVIPGAPESEDEMAKRKAAASKSSKSKTAKTAKAAKTPRPRSAKTSTNPNKSVKPCHCGCGEETNGYFVQGHDARFKGKMLKIERGLIKKSSPEGFSAAVIRQYDWVATKAGGERTTTNYKGEPHKGYDQKAQG